MVRVSETESFSRGLEHNGPNEIHDHYRVTKGRQPTFDKVFAAAKLLHWQGVPFNTQTCVHCFNAQKPKAIHHFCGRNSIQLAFS